MIPTENSASSYQLTNESQSPAKCTFGAQISNKIGEMNSYVNVNIHLLYSIQEISNYILNEDFPYEYKYNFYQELKLTFEKYYKLLTPIYRMKLPSKMLFIDPNELIKELNDLYNENKNMRKIPLEDPTEVLFIIINTFHNDALKHKEMESFIHVHEEQCNPYCLAHDLFYNDLIEEITCLSCEYKSELYKYDNNTYFYEIQMKHFLSEIDEPFEKIYDQLFIKEKALYSQPKTECPVKCGHANVLRRKMLLKSSKYFFLCLSYDTFKHKEIEICKTFIMIPLYFFNRDLFTVYLREYVKLYVINGIICKKGMSEYIYFAFHCDTETYWVYHEDMIIIKLDKWKDVVEYSIRNQLTPIMIIYKEKTFDETPSNKVMNTNEEETHKKQKLFSESYNTITLQDYNKYRAYCKDVEKDTILTYGNESLQKEKLRPVNHIMKVPKKELVDKMKKLKTEMEGQKIKRQSKMTQDIEDSENENERLLEELTDRVMNEDIDNQERLKEIEESNKNKWQCEKCYVYNDKKGYYCTRCKWFSYNAYASIVNSQQKDNNEEDNTIEKNINDNIVQHKGMIVNKNELKNNLRSGGDRCWQCNYFNPFHCLKCKRCRFLIHQTPIDIYDNIISTQDQSAYSLEYAIPSPPKYKRVGLKKEYYNEDIQQKHWIIKENEWICFYCKAKHLKTTNTKFCTKCFKNNK